MILSLSGKKQSGKGTAFSFVYELNRRRGLATKEFSFAYMLKRMAVDILGLKECQAFGTDAEKNTVVPHLLWENFPIPAWEWPDGTIEVRHDTVAPTRDLFGYGYTFPIGGVVAVRKAGPMTGRQVLQFWGSEIFRRQYGEVWADSTIRMVRAWLSGYEDGKAVAVITDCRFPNEVEATLGAGGSVGRLTRNAFDDRHMSETALDADAFDHSRFSFIVDNADLGVAGTSDAIYLDLVVRDIVPETPRDIYMGIAHYLEERASLRKDASA